MVKSLSFSTPSTIYSIPMPLPKKYKPTSRHVISKNARNAGLTSDYVQFLSAIDFPEPAAFSASPLTRYLDRDWNNADRWVSKLLKRFKSKEIFRASEKEEEISYLDADFRRIEEGKDLKSKDVDLSYPNPQKIETMNLDEYSLLEPYSDSQASSSFMNLENLPGFWNAGADDTFGNKQTLKSDIFTKQRSVELNPFSNEQTLEIENIFKSPQTEDEDLTLDPENDTFGLEKNYLNPSWLHKKSVISLNPANPFQLEEPVLTQSTVPIDMTQYFSMDPFLNDPEFSTIGKDENLGDETFTVTPATETMLQHLETTKIPVLKDLQKELLPCSDQILETPIFPYTSRPNLLKAMGTGLMNNLETETTSIESDQMDVSVSQLLNKNVLAETLEELGVHELSLSAFGVTDLVVQRNQKVELPMFSFPDWNLPYFAICQLNWRPFVNVKYDPHEKLLFEGSDELAGSEYATNDYKKIFGNVGKIDVNFQDFTISKNKRENEQNIRAQLVEDIPTQNCDMQETVQNKAKGSFQNPISIEDDEEDIFANIPSVVLPSSLFNSFSSTLAKKQVNLNSFASSVHDEFESSTPNTTMSTTESSKKNGKYTRKRSLSVSSDIEIIGETKNSSVLADDNTRERIHKKVKSKDLKDVKYGWEESFESDHLFNFSEIQNPVRSFGIDAGYNDFNKDPKTRNNGFEDGEEFDWSEAEKVLEQDISDLEFEDSFANTTQVPQKIDGAKKPEPKKLGHALRTNTLRGKEYDLDDLDDLNLNDFEPLENEDQSIVEMLPGLFDDNDTHTFERKVGHGHVDQSQVLGVGNKAQPHTHTSQPSTSNRQRSGMKSPSIFVSPVKNVKVEKDNWNPDLSKELDGINPDDVSDDELNELNRIVESKTATLINKPFTTKTISKPTDGLISFSPFFNSGGLDISSKFSQTNGHDSCKPAEQFNSFTQSQKQASRHVGKNILDATNKGCQNHFSFSINSSLYPDQSSASIVGPKPRQCPTQKTSEPLQIWNPCHLESLKQTPIVLNISNTPLRTLREFHTFSPCQIVEVDLGRHNANVYLSARKCIVFVTISELTQKAPQVSAYTSSLLQQFKVPAGPAHTMLAFERIAKLKPSVDLLFVAVLGNSLQISARDAQNLEQFQTTLLAQRWAQPFVLCNVEARSFSNLVNFVSQIVSSCGLSRSDPGSFSEKMLQDVFRETPAKSRAFLQACGVNPVAAALILKEVDVVTFVGLGEAQMNVRFRNLLGMEQIVCFLVYRFFFYLFMLLTFILVILGETVYKKVGMIPFASRYESTQVLKTIDNNLIRLNIHIFIYIYSI